MINDKQLQRQLDRPPIPDELEDKIIANWQQQLEQSSGDGMRYRVMISACVTLLLLAGLTIGSFYNDPAAVKAAIADIQKDRQQNVGLSISLNDLEKLSRVNLPPTSMPLKMTKFCTLDGDRTIHLQVSGEKQGAVHLFVYDGVLRLRSWQAYSGKTGAMHWRIIKPSTRMSVLVLYTPDMNPDSVDKLLKTMFYA